MGKDLTAKYCFTAEAHSSQSWEYFLTKDSFLGVLRASAVGKSV